MMSTESPVNTSKQTEATDIVEVDDEFSDTASSVNTDTTSLTSTIFEHVYENGRRYHNFRAGKYVMPNDEEEQSRLDMFHHVWLSLMNGKTHAAPLQNPKKALDIGCGTGIWAIDFADEFPECDVEGVDLSPTQPNWVPTNLKFVVDDIEDKWVYQKDSFDYIHSRMMIGSICNWKGYLQNIYDHLKPGAWLELQEADGAGYHSEDGTYDPKGEFGQMLDLMVKAAEASGRPYVIWDQIPKMLEEVGFVDIQVSRMKLPIGLWPKNKKMKHLGAYGLALGKAATEAYGLALYTRVLGMTEQEAKAKLRRAAEELENRKYHVIFGLELLTCRKPTKEELEAKK